MNKIKPPKAPETFAEKQQGESASQWTSQRNLT